MKNLQDEMLVKKCKQGSQEAVEVLFLRYRSLLQKITRGYFLLGSDEEDLMQEAMIGLYKAVVSFDPKHQTSFKTFATICVRRNVFDAIKKSNAQKHKMLNDSVLFSEFSGAIDEETSSQSLLFTTLSQTHPQQTIEEGETYQEIIKQIEKKLSKLEFNILKHYLKGHSYSYIAEKLGVNTKSVDNALSRIKKKLQFLLN